VDKALHPCSKCGARREEDREEEVNEESEDEQVYSSLVISV